MMPPHGLTPQGTIAGAGLKRPGRHPLQTRCHANRRGIPRAAHLRTILARHRSFAQSTSIMV